jgi:hypothetical protein
MQISFFSIVIIGTIGIFLYDPIISICYLIVFPFFGIIFCVMRLWVCSRCPHIKNHSACVQMHPYLTKKIIKSDANNSLKIYEKVGFFFFLYGLPIFPIYWIIKSEYFIIPYFLFIIMHYMAYPIHFCRKCLHVVCPQNTNKKIFTELYN